MGLELEEVEEEEEVPLSDALVVLAPLDVPLLVVTVALFVAPLVVPTTVFVLLFVLVLALVSVLVLVFVSVTVGPVTLLTSQSTYYLLWYSQSSWRERGS